MGMGETKLVSSDGLGWLNFTIEIIIARVILQRSIGHEAMSEKSIAN